MNISKGFTHTPGKAGKAVKSGKKLMGECWGSQLG